MSEKLPKGLAKRGGVYHIDTSRNRIRTRKTLGQGTSLNEAIKALNGFRNQSSELERNKIRYTVPDPGGRPWKISDSWINNALARAQRRAMAKNLACHLTAENILALATASGGRCQVTGIPFTVSDERRFRAHPFMPSIDRINSSLGYENGNVRLVCYCVNVAMSQWGEVVLEKIAKSYMLKLLQKDLDTSTLFTHTDLVRYSERDENNT